MATSDAISRLADARRALDDAAHLLSVKGGAASIHAALVIAARALSELDGLDDSGQARVASVLDASTPDTAAAREWHQALRTLLVTLEGQHGIGRGRRLLLRGVGAVVVLALAATLGTLARETAYGWRGAYHPARDFEGEPVLRRDPAIGFRWRRNAPMGDFPADNFTVRWRTCLTVPEETRLELALGSDDGSRVYLGERLLVDNWNVQAFHWERHTHTFAPGVHALTLEYFEAGADAGVSLELTRPDADNAAVPQAWLVLPGDGGC